MKRKKIIREYAEKVWETAHGEGIECNPYPQDIVDIEKLLEELVKKLK